MPSMQLHSKRFIQLAELNIVKGAMEILSKSDEQLQIQTEIGEKLANNYPD